MIGNGNAFSSFSVNDLQKAKKFYSETLGLEVTESPMGLEMKVAGGKVFVYPKPDHNPATFTVLNFPVDDIDQAVIEATASAEITHTHTDAVAGAVAVAIAAALSQAKPQLHGAELIDMVAAQVPDGPVRERLRHAESIDDSGTAAVELGVGHDTSALDTVPFSLWVVAHHGHVLNARRACNVVSWHRSRRNHRARGRSAGVRTTRITAGSPGGAGG